MLTRRRTLASMLAAASARFARAARAAESVVGLTFVLVNDVYRMDEDAQGHGGLPRLATIVAQERARAAAHGRFMLFVHAGDTLSPSLMSAFDQGAHMIELFNAVGLDVFVPGNHEYDFGRDIYLQRMGEARFSVLAANLRDAAGSALPHHADRRSFEIGGLKLAVIGTTYEASATVSHIDDLVIAPTQATLTAEAAAARADGADFILAVVHADRALGTMLLRSRVADVILSGHNHDLHVEFDGRAVLIESNQDANYVSAVDMTSRSAKARPVPVRSAGGQMSASPSRAASSPIQPCSRKCAAIRTSSHARSTCRSLCSATRSTAASRRCEPAKRRSAISLPTRCATPRRLTLRS